MTTVRSLACAGGLLLLATHAVAQSPNTTKSVELYLDRLARAGHLSGTVLVARGNEVLLERSYGRADYQTVRPNTTETLFAIASPTKPLTGIVTRLLAQRNVISLDDPIAKWIPDFPNGSKITVAHLVTHRSGIPHRVTQFEDEQKQQTPATMTKLASRASLAFEPGAQRLYSSAGYAVLANVLERATGKPYAQLLRELVLAPASATNSIDATEAALATTTRARGHFWTPDGPLEAPTKQLSFLVGGGSLWSTPRDLFRVVRHIADGGFSAAATAGARAENGTIQWTGWSNGFALFVDFNPTTNVTVIFTGNLLSGANDWIVRDVPRLLAGETVVEPQLPSPRIAQLSESRRQQLEGTYSYFGNQQQLKFQSPSIALMGGEYLLLPLNDTTLYAPQNFAEYRVVTDASGAVTALQFIGAANISMTRVR